MKYFLSTVFAIVLTALVLAIGCTDAERSRWSALGDAGDIECYSGGRVIYSGRSTGKINSESHSDGWYFREAGTENLIRISGDCIITN